MKPKGITMKEVITILKDKATPDEVALITGVDAADLTELLLGYIEDNFEETVEGLVAYGLLEEPDEDEEN